MAGIVAIGTSQGGVRALQTLVAGLPADFPAAIVVVLHTGASPSILPSLLCDAGPLKASHAREGEKLRAGHIHVAPPDYHMLVEDSLIHLSRGPRENWARPAIDPLLRCVAQSHGPEAIGVILTGALNDGTAGLFEIKRHGGITIVQDPAEAEAPSMPKSALENVAVNYCVSIEEIAPLLMRLIPDLERSKSSRGVHAMADTDWNFTTPAAQACPECGGAMREEQLGTITNFRCHIGHVMTAEVLAAAKLEMLENDVLVCVRAMHERADLCREIGRRHEALGNAPYAQRWRKAADEAATRAREFAQLAEREWYNPERSGDASEKIAGIHARS